ncbi:hypothetical protein MPNT_500003 [Candidatus Methylacidithermus pantelleriae]|uniref:Uncharacterized protein n=1 Tax=Candidatus Methylacidithermus pantelleriae TaxID=2744239 RepID=A0A8J2FPI8_9BACT|nr:hypothetical protein MPNT_500003 [Candidatus Methylacidithermus pantelleriae]
MSLRIALGLRVWQSLATVRFTGIGGRGRKTSSLQDLEGKPMVCFFLPFLEDSSICWLSPLCYAGRIFWIKALVLVWRLIYARAQKGPGFLTQSSGQMR